MSGINGGGSSVAAIWQGAIARFPLPGQCFVEAASFSLDWVNAQNARTKCLQSSLQCAEEARTLQGPKGMGLTVGIPTSAVIVALITSTITTNKICFGVNDRRN